MPALSPTMTEGNIASWRVKEGEAFSAGDVLLEIETDKATMDVEAQDDGIMMKIMSQDGSKAVPVGARIAVLAEASDDISSLELPADEHAEKAISSGSPQTTESAPVADAADSKPAKPVAKAAGSGSYEHKYPLLPSVGHLVKGNGLTEADVSKIEGTGPGGRLLKGDVLAYLGSINADAPATVSAHFEKLAHLDLSNIKVAAPKTPAAAPKPVEEIAPAAPVNLPLEINVPVSLAKVVEVQNKIQDTLGVFLPISTFITRAAEIANDELPLAQHEPTASELFDAVLGLDKIKSSSGMYIPQISAIPPGTSFVPRNTRPAKRDLIDELAGTPIQRPSPMVTVPTVAGLSSGANVFSLVVPQAEAERAHVFLQRCKLILEEEPGRLVM